MKYALLEHTHSAAGLVNYGDHIQSLAAEQYLPNTDFYVERDYLNKMSYEKAKIIMNGWFTYAPQNWPPNENLIPLFISFHLNPRYSKILLSNKKNIEYLKKYEPIGCRDYKTLEILKEYNIESYFSSCLTTTLDLKYKTDVKTDNIYFVDILYDYDQRIVYKSDPKRILYHTLSGRIFKTLNIAKKNRIIKELIPKEVIEKAISVNQHCSSKLTTVEKFDIARNALRNYASAKMVITSRIHCALPCLALGTPVLFVLDGLSDEIGHLSRFRGILDHINILTTRSENEVNKVFGRKMNVLHPLDINWDTPPENPKSFLSYANDLKEKCSQFINQ